MPQFLLNMARIGFALVACAAAVGFLFGALTLTPAFGAVAFLLALAVGTLIGLPAFLLLQKSRLASSVSSVLLGFAIPAVPTAYFLWPPRYYPDNWSVGVPMVALTQNGEITSAGWNYYFSWIGVLGMFGAVAGLTFWIVLYSIQKASNPKRTRKELY